MQDTSIFTPTTSSGPRIEQDEARFSVQGSGGNCPTASGPQIGRRAFCRNEKARGTSKKKQLVAQLCTELTVHAEVEEEIFYPTVKQALKDKELIGEVEGVEPVGEMFDAKIKVLSEYVKHHVKEEQDVGAVGQLA